MHGKCLCGQIEFEILGAIPKLYQCHCSLCRRQGGSSSNTATIVQKEHFRWLAGQERISSWVKSTGFRSDFCPTCGSPVPNPLRGTPYFWVPAGLLYGETETEIAAHLCVGSKASWDTLSSQGTRYETVPDDLLQFIADLHSDTAP